MLSYLIGRVCTHDMDGSEVEPGHPRPVRDFRLVEAGTPDEAVALAGEGLRNAGVGTWVLLDPRLYEIHTDVRGMPA